MSDCTICGTLLDPDGSCWRCPAIEPTGDGPRSGHVPAVAASTLFPDRNGRNEQDAAAMETEATPHRRIVVTPASAYKPRPVRWLWPDRIPAGSLTLLAGREGIGKSLITVNLAAKLTQGTLPGTHEGLPSRVLFATSEDAWEFTMTPRLLAAGADLNAVGRVEVADDGVRTGLTLPLDVAALRDYILKTGVALLVLDPLTSVIDGRLDHHRDREVRAALEPLARLAEETGCAVVGLVHLGKATGVDPVNLILGSRAFSAVARLAMVAARDPEAEDGTYVLSVEKSNLGRLDVPALTYRVDAAVVDTDEGAASTGLLMWTGESDRNVRDILGDRGDEERDERDEAARWIKSYLIDNGGEAAASDIYAAAKKADFSERTIRRARTRAGAVSDRQGFGGGAVWRLDLA